MAAPTAMTDTNGEAKTPPLVDRVLVKLLHGIRFLTHLKGGLSVTGWG